MEVMVRRKRIKEGMRMRSNHALSSSNDGLLPRFETQQYSKPSTRSWMKRKKVAKRWFSKSSVLKSQRRRLQRRLMRNPRLASCLALSPIVIFLIWLILISVYREPGYQSIATHLHVKQASEIIFLQKSSKMEMNILLPQGPLNGFAEADFGDLKIHFFEEDDAERHIYHDYEADVIGLSISDASLDDDDDDDDDYVDGYVMRL